MYDSDSCIGCFEPSRCSRGRPPVWRRTRQAKPPSGSGIGVPSRARARGTTSVEFGIAESGSVMSSTLGAARVNPCHERATPCVFSSSWALNKAIKEREQVGASWARSHHNRRRYISSLQCDDHLCSHPCEQGPRDGARAASSEMTTPIASKISPQAARGRHPTSGLRWRGMTSKQRPFRQGRAQRNRGRQDAMLFELPVRRVPTK